jgi:hypothetical protein
MTSASAEDAKDAMRARENNMAVGLNLKVMDDLGSVGEVTDP